MATQPINYGPDVSADNQGTNTLASQVGRSQEINVELAGGVASKVTPLIQGVVHNQALKATTLVKDAQAKTLSFIDSNPYVDKSVLQQRMGSDDYQTWHAKLVSQYPQYKDADTVPMYTAATDMFDSETKQMREQAGQYISLPGWQSAWRSTEAAESSAVRDRYVNRMAADQMISDQRAQTLTSVDSLIDSAQGKHDFELAAKAASTSPWLHPNERRIVANKALVAGDSFQAEQAMLRNDVGGMKDAMETLRSANAKDLYPNMNVQQRLALEQRVARAYGYKSAKVTADGLVSPYVDEQGRVDSVSIAKAVAAYQGADKEDVVKAAQAQESESLRIWDAGTSSVQQKIFTAGQDPRTGIFSMDRAQRDPAVRKLADQLNQTAPGKLGALADRDTRRQRLDDMRDRQAQVDEAKRQTKVSHDNLEQIRTLLDDESQAEQLKKLTPAQFDSQLHDVMGGMSDLDLEHARKEFKAFLGRGGKPDERVTSAVIAELKQAAQGDKDKLTTYVAKYEDGLRVVAHAYLRSHPTADPGTLADGMRKEIRAELLKGSVVGGGSLFGDANGVFRYNWERNPDYAGKDFRMPDGTILKGDNKHQAMVKLTKDGTTLMFPPENAEAARADGWK